VKGKKLAATIVEDYVLAALSQAEFEAMDGQTIVGTVPGGLGVISMGADLHDCATDLYGRLQDCVRHFLVNGFPLPLFEGIDLNTQRVELLKSYVERRSAEPEGEFLEDASALEAAFAEQDALRVDSTAKGRHELNASRSAAR